MSISSPLGFHDHQPFSGISDELVYGVQPDGTIVHISMVDRGLACNCRCPACDHVLVAKKSAKQTHHFAHHNSNVSCAHVAETNAHIWAKDVLQREKQLILPPITAEYDGQSVEVRPARRYEFTQARLERRLGSIVPDVILETASGAQLIVEVRVTHACDEEKIQTLLQGGISAIEVDLRHFRNSTDRAAVEEALLKTASREWLSNSKQDQFDSRLQERIEAERERLAKIEEERKKSLEREEHAKVQKERERVERSGKRLVQAAKTFDGYIHEIPDMVHDIVQTYNGDHWPSIPSVGFRVHQKVWQAGLILKYLTYPNALDYNDCDEITVADAMVGLEERLVPAFRARIEMGVRDQLRHQWPNRCVPEEAIENFFDFLAAEGFLEPAPNSSFTVSDGHISQLVDEARRQEAIERRHRSTRSSIQRVIKRLPEAEQEGFSVDRWFEMNVLEDERSPSQLCEGGGEKYIEFERAIKQIEVMCEGGAAVTETLGLPLSLEVERANSRERDRLARAATSRRESLARAAHSQLGDEAEDWLAGPSESDDHLTRIDQASVNDLSYQGARVALEAETRAYQLRRRAEQIAAACRDELREAASRVYDPERAELFLRSRNPRIGRSPLEHCVDQRTLMDCRALLPKTRSGRRIG